MAEKPRCRTCDAPLHPGVVTACAGCGNYLNRNDLRLKARKYT